MDSSSVSSSSSGRLRVRELAPAEFARWDRFVEDHPHGLVTDTSGWRRTLEAAFPHIRGQFLVVESVDTGAWRAGLPLFSVSSWLLGKRLVSVPFASISDPLVADPEDWRLLQDALLARRAQERARRAEIRCLATSGLVGSGGLSGTSTYLHHVLRLDRPESDILASLAKSAVRNELGRARRFGIRIVTSDERAHLTDFGRILAETRRRLSLPPLPTRFFEAAWDSLGEPRRRLYLALHRETPIAALFVTRFRDLVAAEYSGDVRVPGVSGANQLIYWQAILDAHAEGRARFSFGRTAVRNDALRQYKRRWGTVEEPITTFTTPPAQVKAPREASALYRASRSVIRHLPNPLFRGFGAFVYRHLG